MKTSEEEWWVRNAITFSVLLHGFRREGKLSEACDIVREMVKKGFFPTPIEINFLIQSFSQKGRQEEARKFMEECLSNGGDINVVNFTTIIRGFCQEGNLQAALSVLDDMYLNSSKKRDAVTYTAIIETLGKKANIKEATEVTKIMLHKGLIPTPVMYRVIIHPFCQHYRVEDLLKLLEKMLSRKACKTAYNQVIEKLCLLGNPDKAYKLLGKVLRTASRTDAKSCHLLMESYLKKGNPVFSYKVTCRMFSRNLIPDLKLCEKVRKRLALEGKADDADKLVLRFVQRGLIPSQSKQDF